MPAEVNGMPFRALGLLSIMLFALMCGPTAARRSHAPSTGLASIRFGVAPPDFAFPTASGMLKLSHAIGKPVVINFWATWCHPCLDELGVFKRLRQSYGDRIFFITLSNEPVGVAQAYLETHGPDLPLLSDPKGLLFAAYSVSPIPVTVVVNKAGLVSFVSVGEVDWPELQSAVDRAIVAAP
ncbi:MAG: TlpA disulfide reductase family protein [Candidatus Baltobacteraceae bacterium]